MKCVRLLILLLPFVFASCMSFIPEERLYFSWNKPKEEIIYTNSNNYKYNTNRNIIIAYDSTNNIITNSGITNIITNDIIDYCDYEFNIINTNMKLVNTDRGNLIEMGNGIYYKLGAVNPYNRKESDYILKQAVSFMTNNTNAILIVEGHADERGYRSKKVNFNISKRRAEIIRDKILKLENINTNRIHTFAYSDFLPKYDKKTYRNRRVELVILKCEMELEEYIKFYTNKLKIF